MKNRIITLAAIATTTFGLAACQTSTLPPPGDYSKTTSAVNADGTAVDKTTNTTVREDQYGRKSAVVETKTTKDPRGLFNKTTNESTTVIQEK